MSTRHTPDHAKAVDTPDKRGVWPYEVYNSTITRLGKMGLLLTGETDDTVETSRGAYRLIGPDTPIADRVFVDRGILTAVAVDFETDARLRDAYDNLRPALDRIATTVSREEGLRGLATAIARRYLPYNEAAVLEKYRADARTGELVLRPLGDFIEDAAGICAQQGLLAASVLERAIDEGRLPEGSRVRFMTSYNHKEHEAHAFATLMAEGTTWIIDPAESRRNSVVTTTYPGYDFDKYGVH